MGWIVLVTRRRNDLPKEFDGYFNQRNLKLHVSSDYPRVSQLISGICGSGVKFGSFEERFTRIFKSFLVHAKDDVEEFKLLDLNHLSSIKIQRSLFLAMTFVFLLIIASLSL